MNTNAQGHPFFDPAERLKREAKRHYLEYQREIREMDCGKCIAEMVNPRLRAAKLAFNSTMDRLAKIDPSCPTQRL